jgi:hypothetical protein
MSKVISQSIFSSEAFEISLASLDRTSEDFAGLG